ncbi:hypothetical protein [Sorangium sp. So ce233]|uniref:hypothetical protein n=1 Tax=Sorangium sp. So ce233 TaxID=3133290 RepID=UPI003F612378
MRTNEALNLLRQAGRVVCDAAPSNDTDTLRRVMALVESARVALADGATAPAAPPRSAEEVAWEIISRIVTDDEGWAISLPDTVRSDDVETVAVSALAEVITRAREEGAAAERERADRLEVERDEARAWVRRITAAERVLTCVYCGQAYPPGTPGHGTDVLTAHVRVCEKHPMRGVEAELERIAPLLRAARRWAATIRETGRAAEEQIAADLDLAEAVDALDTALATGAAQLSGSAPEQQR